MTDETSQSAAAKTTMITLKTTTTHDDDDDDDDDDNHTTANTTTPPFSTIFGAPNQLAKNSESRSVGVSQQPRRQVWNTYACFSNAMY